MEERFEKEAIETENNYVEETEEEFGLVEANEEMLPDSYEDSEVPTEDKKNDGVGTAVLLVAGGMAAGYVLTKAVPVAIDVAVTAKDMVCDGVDNFKDYVAELKDSRKKKKEAKKAERQAKRDERKARRHKHEVVSEEKSEKDNSEE